MGFVLNFVKAIIKSVNLGVQCRCRFIVDIWGIVSVVFNDCSHRKRKFYGKLNQNSCQYFYVIGSLQWLAILIFFFFPIIPMFIECYSFFKLFNFKVKICFITISKKSFFFKPYVFWGCRLRIWNRFVAVGNRNPFFG